MSTKPKDTARDEVRAQYESVAVMVAALNLDWDRLAELREARGEGETLSTDDAAELAELEQAAGDCADADAARQRIEEDALSVEVRSDWVQPGDQMAPGEFKILLCTGGPAVQIRGELDEHSQPVRAWLEYQDWETPWAQYFGADKDVLLAYCNVFFFGEG